MSEKLELLIHFFVTFFRLLRPGGVKAIMAENIAMRQQLITLSRGRERAPTLTTSDRFIFGIIAFFIGEKRLPKIAVILKPATILKFHRALVKRKYRQLYSSNYANRKPGRKGPDQQLIELVVEMRRLNPRMGYGRISMQIYQAFGIEISRFAVGRILRNHYNNDNPGKGDGPSWLSFIGHMKDSLWSVDLFRCESINLKSHWVMVVIVIYTRRIIGFAVHVGDPDGVAYCRMLNSIISGKELPTYLSTDNDPLFQFHRWKANLRILDIEEIKSVPRVAQSHPYVERAIGITRQEFLDHLLFWNSLDLRHKLDQFQEYYNESRAHSSLEWKTPIEMATDKTAEKKVVALDNYRWKSHCQGLYKLPMAV